MPTPSDGLGVPLVTSPTLSSPQKIGHCGRGEGETPVILKAVNFLWTPVAFCQAKGALPMKSSLPNETNLPKPASMGVVFSSSSWP